MLDFPTLVSAAIDPRIDLRLSLDEDSMGLKGEVKGWKDMIR